MSVSRDDIDRVARLAALSIDEGQLPTLTKQIRSIIAYVAQLERVETTADDTEYRPGNHQAPLRSDDVTSAPMNRKLEEMAPEFRDGFFLVPKLEAFEEQE